MSRKARRRAKKQPHHIMSRSISELDLFNSNEDKEMYLNLIKISADMSLSEMTKEFRGHTSSAIGAYAQEGYRLLSEDNQLFNQIESGLSD